MPAATVNDLPQADRQHLRHLFRFSESLRSLDLDMPVVQISVLLRIAANEGTSQRELCELLDLPSSTVSRSVASLSEVHRLKKPGLGLITWYDDPEDRRTKRLVLTQRGRSFVQKLLEDR